MDPSKSFNQPPGAGNPPPVYQDNPAGYLTSFPGPSAQGLIPGQSVVAVQPAVFVPTTPLANPVPLTNPIPEYTYYSIFTLLCCVLPLGTAALVYSLSTRSANYSGHKELAKKNSKTALTLNNLAIVVGIVLIVFLFLYEFLWNKNP